MIGGGELTEIDLRGSVTVFSRDTDTVTDPDTRMVVGMVADTAPIG